MATALQALRSSTNLYDGVSDEGMLRHIQESYYPDKSFEEVGGMFGYAPASTEEATVEDKPWTDDAKEIGGQLAGGLMVNFNRQVGQAAKAFTDEGSYVNDWAKGVVKRADERAPNYQPNLEGRGFLAETLIKGARSVPSSAATAGAAVLGGTIGAPVMASSLAALALYGGSQYQDTIEKAKEQGVSDEEANQAGLLTGAIQGGLEAAANTLTLGALGMTGKALSKTVSGFLGKATDDAVLKPWLVATGKNVAGQVITEPMQDVGTAFVEQDYGIDKNPDYLGIAKESAQGALGMSAFFGLPGLAGHYQNAQRAKAIDTLIANPEAGTQEERLALVDMLHKEASSLNIPDVDVWARAAKQDVLENNPIRRSIQPDVTDVTNASSVDEAIQAADNALRTPDARTLELRSYALNGGLQKQEEPKALEYQRKLEEPEQRGNIPPETVINFPDGSTTTAYDYFQQRLDSHGDVNLAKQEMFQALNGLSNSNNMPKMLENSGIMFAGQYVPEPPDANTIVRNRTIQGKDTKQSIDRQYQLTGITENDIRKVGEWEVPIANIKQRKYGFQPWEAPISENEITRQVEVNRAYYEKEQAELQQKEQDLLDAEMHPDATPAMVKQYRKARAEIETQRRQRADDFRKGLGFNIVPATTGEARNTQLADKLAQALSPKQQETRKKLNAVKLNAKTVTPQETQPATQETSSVPTTESQISPEVTDAAYTARTTTENNSAATSPDRAVTPENTGVGRTLDDGGNGLTGRGTGGNADGLSRDIQQPTVDSEPGRALAPILTQPKEKYLKAKSKEFDKANPKAIDAARNQYNTGIESSYDDDYNSALADAPFDYFASLPEHKNLSPDTQLNLYNALRDDYKLTPLTKEQIKNGKGQNKTTQATEEAVKQPWENINQDSTRWHGSRVEIQPQLKGDTVKQGTVKTILKGSSSPVVEVQVDGLDSTFRYTPEQLKVLSIVDNEQVNKKQDNLYSTSTGEVHRGSTEEVPEKSTGEVKPKTGKFNANAKSGSVDEQYRLSERGSKLALLHSLNEKVKAYSNEEIDNIAPENIDAVQDFLLKKYNDSKQPKATTPRTDTSRNETPVGSSKAEPDVLGEEEVSAYPEFNEIAKEYGKSIANDGEIIHKNDKPSGVVVKRKGGRVRIESKSDGKLLASGGDEKVISNFIEKFWLAEKIKTQSQPEPPTKESPVTATDTKESQLKGNITRAKTKLKTSKGNLEEKIKLKANVKQAEKELQDYRLNTFEREDSTVDSSKTEPTIDDIPDEFKDKVKYPIAQGDKTIKVSAGELIKDLDKIIADYKKFIECMGGK